MYDCIIIGSGITGATIARKLARYNLNTLILEKEFDVATEATMANSAIVHSGHDPIPGTLKAKFNVSGNRMYKKMSEELDIPYMACGGMVLAASEEDVKMLDVLYKRGLENGLTKDEISYLSREDILKREPNISDHVIAGLDLPTTAVTFPWEAAIANIENAMDNGVSLKLEQKVIDIKTGDNFKVITETDEFEAKVVINATGVYGQMVSEFVKDESFTITPRRGEYYVLDKNVYEINNVLYPCPSEKGKGVIVTPQYHGNVLLGPTSEFVSFEDMFKTTFSGLEYIKKNSERLIKNIPYHKIIRSFAGARATSSTHDFVIDDKNGFINVVGIESPGLTAAPSMAEYVVDELVSRHFDMVEKTDFNPIRKKVVRLSEMTTAEKNELVKEDPTFGKLVCRCETITEGEVIDSINRNCGARSITGVKNRVRAGAGRCQGGFCQTEVIRILSNVLEIDKTEVNYSKTGSNVLQGKTKGEL